MAEAKMARKFRKRLAVSLTACVLFTGATPGFAGQDDKPSAGEMTADIAVARPLGMVATVAGSAAFLVSLPFSALGGNVPEAAQALVVEPAKATFMRCLGCKATGRYQAADK